MRQNHQVGGCCCASADKILTLGKFGVGLFEGKVGVKMKSSWKRGASEEEAEKKVKIPSIREILEVEEGPGIRELHGKDSQRMLTGMMHKAQGL